MTPDRRHVVDPALADLLGDDRRAPSPLEPSPVPVPASRWTPEDEAVFGLSRRLGVDPDSPFSDVVLAAVSASDLPAPAVPPSPGLDPVEDAVAAIARGEVVVVVDDVDRENEGDLIMAAEFVTPEKVAFFLRHTSGLLCAALSGERCEQLRLPLMVPGGGTEVMGTAFTVSVDARHGVHTGISPADRATTVSALVDPRTRPEDLDRPGHVFPLRAREGGVLVRPGHTEATVDLARLAGLEPAGLLCEITSGDKSGMARRPDLQRLAARFGMPMISVADLVRYRRRTERLVRRRASATLPTEQATFTAHVYESLLDGRDSVALVLGDVAGDEPVLVRLHSECLTGDAFGSLRCDCGPQLDAALEAVAAHGRGVVVYLRGHEGRGIGLAQKISAYALQDGAGLDTVDANTALGLPVDARSYDEGAQVLGDLGVRRVRLMTNNPDKVAQVGAAGVEVVERVPALTPRTRQNARYLESKRSRMGHELPGVVQGSLVRADCELDAGE